MCSVVKNLFGRGLARVHIDIRYDFSKNIKKRIHFCKITGVCIILTLRRLASSFMLEETRKLAVQDRENFVMHLSIMGRDGMVLK